MACLHSTSLDRRFRTPAACPKTSFPAATCTTGPRNTCCGSLPTNLRWLGEGPLRTGRRMPLWATLVAVPSGLFLTEWVSSEAVRDGCWELGTPGWNQWELHRAKPSILSPSPPNSCRLMAPERPASLKPTARRHCCSRRLQRALAVGSLEPAARRHCYSARLQRTLALEKTCRNPL